MKFKKVEIQAFRAYNLVNEGTFDFSTDKDDHANFISIYAPNGFGKTSFYDAVEWGVTHNIHRFLRRYKFNQQVAKTEKNLNDATQTNILRNRYAAEDTPAYVNLYTTDPDLPVTTELKKPRKGQADYKFDERETVRGYFQEVILSQEWIDSFLKEDNGSDRYQTFIKYFGDKELDLYYRTLVGLLKTNEENIKRLQKDIAGLQLNLVFDGDHDILSHVNQVITQLNEADQKLNYIDAAFTEGESAIYGSLISSRSNELAFKIVKLSEGISNIEEAIAGSYSLDGLKVYFTILLLKSEDEQKILEHQKILTQFKDLSKNLNIQSNLEKQKLELVEQLEYIQELVTGFPQYLEVVSDISKNSLDISERTITSSDHRKSKVEKDGQISDINKDINELFKQITSFNQLLERLHGIGAEIIQKRSELNQLNKQIGENESAEKKNTSELVTLREQELNLDSFIHRIRAREFSAPIETAYLNFKNEIDILQRLQTDWNKLTNTLKSIENAIKEQQSFNADLEELVKKGLDLINKSLLDSCPLCNHTHDSYKELVNKVTDNALLSKRLQDLLNEQSSLATQLKSNREKDKYQFDELLNKLSLLKSSLNGEIRSNLEEGNKLTGSIAQLKESSTKTEKSLQALIASLDNKTVEEYRLWVKIQIHERNEKIKVLQTKLEGVESDQKKLEANIKILDQEINQLNEDDRQIKNDESYKVVQAYILQQVNPSHDIDINVLNNLLKSAQNNHAQNINESKVLLAEINKLKVDLKSYDEPTLILQLSKAQTDLQELNKRIIRYQEFFTTTFNKDIKNDTQASLLEFLNNKRETDLSAITDAEKNIELFTLLEKLKDDLIPFLRFEKAKENEKTKKEKFKFLKGSLKKHLDTEKQRVAAHIDKQVNSFFYEDVINALYRKIDPHPDYKTIKFKCDFTDDKPQLNVCVIDEAKELLQIPNLYFSTAQLNILSLSIFLAKALHAKDDDGKKLECIFIDDPIQSMDSINILSTIDLLRSIVVNHERQIILSTHDSNFHSLLMKKIPKDLFNSKFMELETFGTVKRDVFS